MQGLFARLDVGLGNAADHLIDFGQAAVDGLEHLQGMLVNGAEVALQAIPRVDVVLAVGDRGGGAKDNERQRDRCDEQPVQRPFGAPVFSRGRGRQNVSQETLHF